MIFSAEILNELRNTVGTRLTDKRYHHTLGVEKAAVKIAKSCGYDDTSEISAAALLHDISKEYSEAEVERIISDFNISLSESDKAAPQVIHAITAPFVILRDFPQFATDTVLSAVRKHTVADEQMSLCDEIIFVADYIEDGRTYSQCVQTRERLYQAFAASKTTDECRSVLHIAVYTALSNTITALSNKGWHIHEKSMAAYRAISERLGYGDAMPEK